MQNRSGAPAREYAYIYAVRALWRRGVLLLGLWAAAAWGWAAQVERYDLEAWLRPAQNHFEVVAHVTVSGHGTLELWLPRVFQRLEAPGARVEARAHYRIRYQDLEPGQVLVIRAALEGPAVLDGYFDLGAPRGYALDAWYPAELEYRPRPYTLTLHLPAGVRAVGPGLMVEAPGRVTFTGDGFGTPAFAYGPYQRVASGRVEVWYTPEVRPAGGPRAVRALAAHVAAIVRRYEALFGVGPRGPVRLVALELPGRMEGYGLAYTVLVQPHRFAKLTEGRIEPGMYAFLAHELAHTWWGNRVVPQEPGAWFLTEGTANYLAALLVEERFGSRVAGRGVLGRARRGGGPGGGHAVHAGRLDAPHARGAARPEAVPRGPRRVRANRGVPYPRGLPRAPGTQDPGGARGLLRGVDGRAVPGVHPHAGSVRLGAGKPRHRGSHAGHS